MRLYGLLGAGLLISFIAAVSLGDVTIGMKTLRDALMGEAPPQYSMILWDVRLPRACAAALIGAALASAGTVTQTLLRNPLAEPGILGINSGAALVAVTVIVTGVGPTGGFLPLMSFAGALGMSCLIYLLAWKQGVTAMRLILVGVGLGALATALSSFISTFADISTLQRLMVWMMGSLQDSRWDKFLILALWLPLPLGMVWVFARELDLIDLGEDVARGLGQHTQIVRGLFLIAVSALAGAAVSFGGLVPFVGLAAPHMARRIGRHALGASHKTLLPISALIGAMLVLISDLIARRAFAPVQLPVGLITALIGTPFFAWFYWKTRND